MSELKPCPFCGGKAKLYTDGLTLIICQDCNLTVSNSERSIIKLTGQWNTRNESKDITELMEFINSPIVGNEII